jgi:hypothetical protein
MYTISCVCIFNTLQILLMRTQVHMRVSVLMYYDIRHKLCLHVHHVCTRLPCGQTRPRHTAAANHSKKYMNVHQEVDLNFCLLTCERYAHFFLNSCQEIACMCAHIHTSDSYRCTCWICVRFGGQYYKSSCVCV